MNITKLSFFGGVLLCNVLITINAAILSPAFVNGHKKGTDEHPLLRWGGTARLDSFFDTRQCVGTSDGSATLYPKKYTPDSNGCDVNARERIGLSPAASEIWFQINGPTVKQAELSARIDFYYVGAIAATMGLPRIYYAFIRPLLIY